MEEDIAVKQRMESRYFSKKIQEASDTFGDKMHEMQTQGNGLISPNS